MLLHNMPVESVRCSRLVVHVYMPRSHSLTPEKESLEKVNFGLHESNSKPPLMKYCNCFLFVESAHNCSYPENY